MKGLGALVLLITAACSGGSGSAVPAEVELQWPDAAAKSTAPMQTQEPVQAKESAQSAPEADAGATRDAAPAVSP